MARSVFQGPMGGLKRALRSHVSTETARQQMWVSIMSRSDAIIARDQGSGEVAKQLALGFKHHDQRNRQEAVDAFAVVDRFQFRHVSAEAARKAAAAYVDALWEKDTVEESCVVDSEIDAEALDAADWEPVRRAFGRRALIAGIDSAYAELSTVAWRRHKTGGDYWTPMMRAQRFELRAALQDADYPHKPRYGQSGFGPEASRYALGVELHDTRRWEQAIRVMTPYYQRIGDEHEQETSTAELGSPTGVP